MSCIKNAQKIAGSIRLSETCTYSIPIDINSLFNRVQATPGEFGFTNVTNACLVGTLDDVAQGNFSVCSNPNDYLFWDGVHPSTRVHSIMAESALSGLNTQSLPKSWQVE
ncbi:MAG: SGNH/GDSL hydrolase family protein [Fischerella sp.]|nr:SGNH/GDSL hydrolase family protein [Fischerella sp.]